MIVRPAKKIGVIEETDLRRLVECEGDAPREYVYLKDGFEFGGHSQLFVGAQRAVGGGIWEPRVFKRVSALPAHTKGGLRHTLAREKRKIAIELGMAPNPLPWQQQGTMSRRAIYEEIAAVAHCSAPFAKNTTVVSTSRDGVAAPSKYYMIMPPAHTDFLGVIHRLEAAPAPLRRNIALMFLREAAAQLHDMHAYQRRAHGDVRSENILCVRGRASTAQVLLWDFGLAVSGDAAIVTQVAREDMRQLGKVFAMLVAPDFRSELADVNLAAVQRTIGHRYPDLAPILAGLWQPDPELRWSAGDVLHHLNQWYPTWAPDADTHAFLLDVRPLADAIDERWAAFTEEMKALVEDTGTDIGT